MKRIYIILAAISLLIGTVSCNRKVDTPEPAPVTNHTFCIEGRLPQLGQDADVKGTLESFISATWTEGDEVSVVNLTTGKVLYGTLTADRDGVMATFSGSVNGTISAGDCLSLFYPSIPNATGHEMDYTDMTMDISSQSKSAGVLMAAAGIFTAGTATGEYTGLNVNFEYGVSYLKLNLSNLPCIPGGCQASKVVIRNISTEVTCAIASDHKSFVISTTEEKAAKGLIEISGTFNISENGVLMLPVAVAPADSAANRLVEVHIPGDGIYSASLTAADLSYNRYYNTVADGFVKTGIDGVEAYGAYLSSGVILDQYQQYCSTIISGTEAGEKDFTLVRNTSLDFWTMKGLPESAQEGDTFTARFVSNGVTDIPSENIEGAKVFRSEPDGDFSKLWITAHTDQSDYLFIIRK